MTEDLSTRELELLDSAEFYSHTHLPVAAAYCRRLGLAELVNGMAQSRMRTSPGAIVTAMVLDTLTGRNPLYRLEEFMAGEDIELLLGQNLSPHAFSDTNVARAMDAVFDAGASRILTELGIQAVRCFAIDLSVVSYDTTSTNVWGDYRECEEATPPPGPVVTYGHSKDGHPGLKQFMTELLCVERGVPIFGRTLDGNSSDKNSNNKILTDISAIMARHGLGPGAFVYVADSAMVTENNLKQIGENLFVTRLPATYSECARAIAEAVDGETWIHLGCLAENASAKNRPCAVYRIMEKSVVLYGKKYRAVVVHSNAHDKRRQKKLEKNIRKSHGDILKETSANPCRFFCRADADAAATRAGKLSGKLHKVTVTVSAEELPTRGRPPKDTPRKTRQEYVLAFNVELDAEAVAREREQAGCFVLLTNAPESGENGMDGKKVLLTYKGQYGVESDFGFLKDPLVVNDLFLKKPSRIEALGMILIISLVIWRLMERSLRTYVENTGIKLPGWDKKMTDRPTAFMMSTKFININVIKIGSRRLIPRGLRKEIPPYLKALGVDEKVFTELNSMCEPIIRQKMAQKK